MRKTLSTVLALAATLTAASAFADSPSAYRLASSSSMKGALLGETFKAIKGAYNEADGWPSLDGMTREALLLERRRVEDERPGIGGAIAMAAIGGGLIIFSYVPFYVAAYSYGTAVIVGIVVGAIMIAGGGALLTIGLIKLFRNINERRAYGDRLDEINRRLERMDGAPPLPGQDPYQAPPPPPPGAVPPPPPPAAQGNVPDSSLLIAQF